MIYLEENGLLDRAVLEEKTSAATAEFHTLSDKIKSAEQRMAELKVMQQHIINYAMNNPQKRKAMEQAKRDEQIATAKERTAAAQARIDAAEGK